MTRSSTVTNRRCATWGCNRSTVYAGWPQYREFYALGIASGRLHLSQQWRKIHPVRRSVYSVNRRISIDLWEVIFSRWNVGLPYRWSETIHLIEVANRCRCSHWSRQHIHRENLILFQHGYRKRGGNIHISRECHPVSKWYPDLWQYCSRERWWWR